MSVCDIIASRLEALRPQLASLRVDRHLWWAGETFKAEIWLLSDALTALDKLPVSVFYRLGDGEEIAWVQTPYFRRTVERFCGHKNTPNDKTTRAPGIVKKGNVVYMAHPMATAYNTYGSLYQKRYFMLALEQLFTGGAFRVGGMGAMGRATMIHQKEQNRYCMNLLYAAPVKRGLAEVIEDIMPVYNIEIALNIPETVKRAYLPLRGEELAITRENGLQKLVLPKLECHESIVLEY